MSNVCYRCPVDYFHVESTFVELRASNLITFHQMCLLSLINSFADRDKPFYMQRSTLAKMFGMTLNAYDKSVKRLRELNLLYVEYDEDGRRMLELNFDEIYNLHSTICFLD